MSDQGGTPEAGWQPDPHGRHEYRYWDGTAWTDQVSDGGVVATDPPDAAPAATPGETPTPAPAPAGGGKKVSVGLLAVIALGVAAVVAVLVVFVFGGDDDSSGTGDFAGTISDEEPFVVRSFEAEAGQPIRAVVIPADDLDAAITLAVDPEVATSDEFAVLDGSDPIREDDLLSAYSENFSELLSGVGDEDLSADLSEAIADNLTGDFSDFVAQLDENLPALSGAGIPFGTDDFNGEGDPEGTIFLAPVDGTYSVIVSGVDSEGEVEGRVEVGSADEDFELDEDAEDPTTAFLAQFGDQRDFFCDEEFWDDDPKDVSEFAATLCDEDAWDELLSSFSEDFSDDFSSDFTSDFSDDFSSDFSDDFSDEPVAEDFQGTIAVGDRSSGFVEAGGADVWEITGDGSEVVISIRGTSSTGGLDPTVAVRDSGGTEIGFDDDGADRPLDSRLAVTLEAGETYEIVVAGFSTTEGDYRITVR